MTRVYQRILNWAARICPLESPYNTLSPRRGPGQSRASRCNPRCRPRQSRTGCGNPRRGPRQSRPHRCYPRRRPRQAWSKRRHMRTRCRPRQSGPGKCSLRSQSKSGRKNDRTNNQLRRTHSRIPREANLSPERVTQRWEIRYDKGNQIDKSLVRLPVCFCRSGHLFHQFGAPKSHPNPNSGYH